jgi:hypothetical protein
LFQLEWLMKSRDMIDIDTDQIISNSSRNCVIFALRASRTRSVGAGPSASSARGCIPRRYVCERRAHDARRSGWREPVGKRHLMRDTVEGGRRQDADWSLIVRSLSRKGKMRLKARQPRQDQKRAIAAAGKHFIETKAARGRLIMPCGTSKSLTTFWIAKAIKASTTVAAVPSLGLSRQSVLIERANCSPRARCRAGFAYAATNASATLSATNLSARDMTPACAHR